MAKPLELITELEGEDAKRFLEDLEKPISRENKRALKRAVALKDRLKI